MNIISTIFGIISLILLLLIIFPVLGAVSSWISLLLAIVGLIFGALSSKTSGRNLNIVVIVIALIRLSIGGGLL